METKTLSYADTARLCMESLMEKYFNGPVGDNVLFMAFTDGDKVDCAVAGKGENIVNTLCNCCSDNDDVLTLLARVVKTMLQSKLAHNIVDELVDKFNKLRNNDEQEE